MDFESAKRYTEQRVATDAERSAIDQAAEQREPGHSQVEEVLTPSGHFERLYERVQERMGLRRYDPGGELTVTGKTESGTPVGVKLTIRSPRFTGPHAFNDGRKLEAQWFERGEPLGPREFASEETAKKMPDNPHVLRDLVRLEESVTAAAELIDGDESSRQVAMEYYSRPNPVE